MINILMKSAWGYRYGHDFIGVGKWLHDGFIFFLKEQSIEFQYFGYEQLIEIRLLHEQVLYISCSNEVLVGSIPAIEVDEKFEPLGYFDDNVATATRRVSTRESVELFIEGKERYEVKGPIYIKGYKDGVFYGDRSASTSMVGISKGEVVWELEYKKLADFRILYPFKQEHHFYLSENNQFQCYSYSGGKHVFNIPLSEIPSEVLEFDGRTVFQTSKNIISLDESGSLLGSINLPHDKNVLYEGHHLLANDDNHIYVIDRETSDVVIYDYSLSERNRVSIPKDFSVHFQRVSSELNALNLQCAKENIIGSSYMSFWHPNETLGIDSFISDENNYSVERIENDGKSSYEVMIDTDNKHDFFRLCDVIVMDVANRYGEDYCDREEVDRQFGGDIRVLVNSKLFEMEPDWIATIQDRLNDMIKTLGGNMQGGVVSGDKQTYIDVTLIPQG